MRWALVSFLVVGASVARADEPTVEDPFGVRDPRVLKEATALFDEGRRLLAKGDDDGACDRFAKSLILEAAPGTELNAGSCLVRRHKLAEAWRLFDAAAIQLRASGAEARAKFAQEHADGLVPLLGALTLLVDRPVTLDINARHLAASHDLTTYVDPGTIMIVAHTRDGAEFMREYTAVAGKTETVQIEVLAPAARPVELGEPHRRRGWVIAAAVIAVVGAGGIISGTTKIATASENEDRGIAAAHCVRDRGSIVCGSTSDANLANAAIDSAAHERTTGTEFLVGGLVLVAVGAGVFVFAPRDQTVIAPTATTTSVGVELTTRF